MKITRKEFLEITGASLVALAGGKALVGVAESVVNAGELPSSVSASVSAPAKRLAMVIDTRICRQHPDCTKCIDACNQAHNVPQFNDPAHEVKWVWEAPIEEVFASEQIPYLQTALKGQNALVLCNHCDTPPCVRVCPTGATWKRAQDGIVMMDWHRCIGCRYCMAACPYGSRSFNWVDPRPHLKHLNPDYPTREKGVVEKCTFCPERIDRGQLPICVEACPEGALTFGDLNDLTSPVRKLLGAGLTLRRRPELGTGPNVYYII